VAWPAEQAGGGRVVEGAFDLGAQMGPVLFRGEQVVGVLIEDLLGDLGLAPHGIDGIVVEYLGHSAPRSQIRAGGFPAPVFRRGKLTP